MAENTDKKKGLFREKSIERMESPEKLNDYLRVTSPGVWLLLGTVIALLIGVCIWGVFGTIRATSSAAVVGGEGQNVCYVPASALQGVLQYKLVTVNGQDLELAPSVLEPQVTTKLYMRCLSLQTSSLCPDLLTMIARHPLLAVTISYSSRLVCSGMAPSAPT